MFEVLRDAIGALRPLLAELDVSGLSGLEAKTLVEEFADLERLAGAGRTLAAGREAETGGWVHADGVFRDAGAWVASVTGSTVGAARASLETAERLAGLPATEAAFRSGSLSVVQADAVTSAAVADPESEELLLAHAASDGVCGLRKECARVEAAASTDQEARYHAVRARRSLRHRAVSDVEGLIEMRGPLDETSRVMAALGPAENELFEQARDSGRIEAADALAFDAMVQTADESAEVAERSSGSRAPATVVYHVDHTAYTRGWTVRGEMCEIAGVGPIPVSVVQKLATDAIHKALITDGTDVLAVSHLHRSIPARLRTALEARDPECVIEGCHVDRHLEIDHNQPVCNRGPTALWNLSRLCHHHHHEKTHHQLAIVGTGTNRRLVKPGRQPRREPARDQDPDPPPDP